MPVIHFQHESLGSLRGQLSAGEVHAATFHPSAHEVHASLNDGRRMTVTYPPAQERSLQAQLRSKNVPVKIALVSTHKAAPVHHKLRYIVGGVLIVVILVVLAILLLGRKRELAEDEHAPHEGAAPS